MKNEKNSWKSITVIVVVLAVLAIVMAGTASAKSLYVIQDIRTSPTPIQAYDIQPTPNYLVYQATYNVPYHGIGAVGLALDTGSETMFVTYEGSNMIEMIDARTMTCAGNTTVAGASNLAGIVVDQDKDLLYAVDRYRTNLYIYDLNLVLQDTVTLSANAIGIALDEINDLLYVTDYSPTVRYYDTTNWQEQGNFTVSHNAVGIEIDDSRQTVYTVAGFAGTNLLSKYDLATGTESTANLGHGGMGVTVDEATGLVYVSGGYDGDDVSVWDPTTLTQSYTTGSIAITSGPCDLIVEEVAFNPLNLTKDDGLAGECVNPRGTITYTICYDNIRNPEVHNVTLVDNMPIEVSFVSATDGGTYDSVTHTVTWDIGTIPAGTPQQCVQLVAKVDATVTPGTNITNSVTISGDEPGYTGPTTMNSVTCTELTPTPAAVPILTPIGIIALVGLLSVIAAMSIRTSIRKRR